MNKYLRTIRPHQYLKNLFIFAPLFFAGEFFNLDSLSDTTISFLLFSLLASSVYVFNDILDKKEDQKHPKKRFRPIASGQLRIKEAWTLSVALALFSLVSFLCLNIFIFYTAIIYLFLNIMYSVVWKHIAPYDIVIIAVGFVLRLYVGSYAADIELSKWIIINTFFLALFLAAAKRYSELVKRKAVGGTYISTRRSLNGYSELLILTFMSISASISMVSYLMFTINNYNYMYVSAIFVMLGFMRFLQIVLIGSGSEEPTRVLMKDRGMQVIIFLWLFFFVKVLYYA